MKRIKKLISLASAAAVTVSLFAGLSVSAQDAATGYSYNPDTGVATWDFTAENASTTAATNGLSWGWRLNCSETGIGCEGGWVGNNYPRYIMFTPSSSGTITVTPGENPESVFITKEKESYDNKLEQAQQSGDGYIITCNLEADTTYYIRSTVSDHVNWSVKSITYEADEKYYTESGNTSTWDFTAFGLTVDNVTTKYNGLMVHSYGADCTVSPSSGVSVDEFWCGNQYNRSIEYTPTMDGTVKVYANRNVIIYKNAYAPADENKINVTPGEGCATAELKANTTYYIEFDNEWTVSKVEFTEKTETEEPDEPTEPEKPTAVLTDAEWTVEDGSDIGYTVDSAKNNLTAPDGTVVYGYSASFKGLAGDSTSYTKVTATVKKKDGGENDIKTQEKSMEGLTLNGGEAVFYIISNAELDASASTIVLE